MAKKVLKKKKAAKGGGGGKNGAKEEPLEAEDWLGEASSDEGNLGGSSGSDDDDDGVEGASPPPAQDGVASDEEGDEEEGAGDEPVDDDAEGPAGDQGDSISRVLAKVASGKQSTDLKQVKQAIHDDASLLSCWRKATELGEKRTRTEVFQTLVGNCSIYFGYAEELAEYFLQMFSPEQAVKFFEANEQQRPLTVRTNSLKARRSSLMQALTNRKVNCDPVGPWTKVGLKVYDAAVPVGATPEYLGGHYMIQSASSFVPVMALAPQQNEVILDMAAAPGGKTTYIGQLMRNTGTLFANDLRKERCKSLVANCHRMGLTNVVATNMDGRKLQANLPRLDRVLLDAPCSGAGIIARDPSVKVKRGMKEFEENSRLQKELLTVAIDMVDAGSKTGGYIVYSTCSVSVEENEAVVDFALRTRNVELVSFTSAVNFGVEGLAKYRERRFHPSVTHCRRFYPHVHNMDGFFVAKFKKISNDIPERPKKDRSKNTDHVQVWGEEKWTPEMMETVVDFDEGGKATENKPLNKVERKKLRRVERLKAEEAARTAANAPGVDSANAGAGASGEPEEEPKPTTEATRKGTLKKNKKKIVAEKEDGAAETAPPSAKKKLKRRRAEEPEAAAEVRKTKKKPKKA